MAFQLLEMESLQNQLPVAEGLSTGGFSIEGFVRIIGCRWIPAIMSYFCMNDVLQRGMSIVWRNVLQHRGGCRITTSIYLLIVCGLMGTNEVFLSRRVSLWIW